ncbi:MauE/DoxX family redox-associated membrane protein [Rhodococcus sp. NPDC047139]|uniref:MauE/DoxX family redox-associated membrane protein n=1 Tax=Rhodococcus sp. NPDC047139 TaxID=3155141 RepID=UPI0033CB3E81
MLWLLIASIVGGTLLLAGVPKIRDRDGLLRVVRGYRLLPAPIERAVALGLPWLEIVLGVALVTGIAGRYAAALAALLFAGFWAGLSINLLRGRRDLDCGCFAFGAAHEVPRIGWFHAARAAAFTAVAALLAIVPAGPATLAEHVLAVALAALLLAAAVTAAQLRSIVHPGRRPVDAHLSNASIELRAASTLSRY